MFGISIPINSTIHLPESEKSGGDLRNKRLFFHCGQQSEWETGKIFFFFKVTSLCFYPLDPFCSFVGEGKQHAVWLMLLLAEPTRWRWSHQCHTLLNLHRAGTIRYKIQSLTTCRDQQWICGLTPHILYKSCLCATQLTVICFEVLDSKKFNILYFNCIIYMFYYANTHMSFRRVIVYWYYSISLGMKSCIPYGSFKNGFFQCK